jgi:hypothetical protein
MLGVRACGRAIGLAIAMVMFMMFCFILVWIELNDDGGAR